VTWALTAVVDTVNVAVFFPPATVTEPRTVAALLLLARLTVMPAVGAAVPREMVPVEVFPPTTEVGLRVNEIKAGGSMVSDAVWVTPFKLPLIVAVVGAATEVVFTTNVWCVEPAGTVTEAGTVADNWLLDNETTIPPTGAAPESVTVPAEEDNPITVAGVNVTDVIEGRAIVNVAISVTDPSVAVMVAGV
jgi:hypothetical protein